MEKAHKVHKVQQVQQAQNLRGQHFQMPSTDYTPIFPRGVMEAKIAQDVALKQGVRHGSLNGTDASSDPHARAVMAAAELYGDTFEAVAALQTRVWEHYKRVCEESAELQRAVALMLRAKDLCEHAQRDWDLYAPGTQGVTNITPSEESFQTLLETIQQGPGEK